MLVESGKKILTDQKFDSNESNSKFRNCVFVRAVATRKTFTKVDFKYSFFETCYLRKCHFDTCDFTGCRFMGTQFTGSTFAGCKFDYATFERTIIDPKILDTECPGHENLKSLFSRTLRTNFQQLGYAVAANKAMKIELSATEVHLRKAWQSNESYYRSHHRGPFLRTIAFLEWMKFKALDFIWGNGENLLRLIRSVFIFVGLMAVFDVTNYGDPSQIRSYYAAFSRSIEIFVGALTPNEYWKGYLALITCVRLIAVGLFISILVRKFSRR